MATNWITLDVADLASFLNGPQLNALRTAALKGGQGDPVAAIINAKLDGIRLEIASCPVNVLSATAHSIPPELKAEACALIIADAQTRLSIALSLSDDQKDAIRRATRKLERIAACDLKVSTPADPEPNPSAQSGHAVSVVVSRRRQASPSDMRGL